MRRPLSVTLTACAGLLIALLHNLKFYSQENTLFVSPYWVGFFVQNYQDHYRRRALIGTICRIFWPHGVSTLSINLISMLVLGTLLTLTIYAWNRLSSTQSTLITLLSFAFFAGPFFGILFEVLGDPLQLAFLLFFTGFLWIRKHIHQSGMKLLAGLALIGVAFLIHEASIFFLIPALPFFLYKSPKVKDFAIPSLLLLGLLGVSFAWSHVEPHLTYRAVLFPHDGPFSATIDTPDFKNLLATEKHDNLSSRHAVLLLAEKIVDLAALACVGLLAVAACLPYQSFKRFFTPFLCISIYCVPLWLIAHDWARFLSYSFLIALIAAAVHATPIISPDDGNPAGCLSSPIRIIRELSENPVLQMAVLFVLLEKPGIGMRINGMANRELATLAAFVVLAIMVWRRHPGANAAATQ